MSDKHFPGPDFPLWKWEKLTYSIVFAKIVGQHFPLCIFMKMGKVNLASYYLNKTWVWSCSANLVSHWNRQCNYTHLLKLEGNIYCQNHNSTNNPKQFNVSWVWHENDFAHHHHPPPHRPTRNSPFSLRAIQSNINQCHILDNYQQQAQGVLDPIT